MNGYYCKPFDPICLGQHLNGLFETTVYFSGKWQISHFPQPEFWPGRVTFTSLHSISTALGLTVIFFKRVWEAAKHLEPFGISSTPFARLEHTFGTHAHSDPS